MTQTMTVPTSTGQPVYEITQADKDRQKAISEAWKAYDGDFEPQLEKTPEGIDPNVVINQCSPISDTGGDFLFGQELEISVEENAPKETQELLDKVWGKKEVRVPLLQELFQNGSLGRNAFMRIKPSKTRPGRDTTYRLVNIDPAIVCMKTAPQDCDTVLLYCLQYSETQQIDGKPQQVFYREEIMRIDPDGEPCEDADEDDTWQIMHWTQVGSTGMEPKNGSWVPDPGGPIFWNYPFPPIFHCKNLPRSNDPWGRADIRKDIIGTNKSLNLTLSTVMSDQIIYALPFIYGNEIGEGNIERKPGRIIGLPTSTGKITAVAIPTDIPGALSVANDLRSSIDETSSVPGVATGRMSTVPHGNLPGVTIELLFMSLIKQTHKKRCLYGKLIIDVSGALLVLAGLANKIDDIDITLAWQDPLPKDNLPAIQAAVTLDEIGVSKTTRMRDLGYDPEEEAELLHSELEQKLNEPTLPPPILFPPGLPGAPLLPNQPPPAKPGVPAPAGMPPTAIGGPPK